jgi:hypothetical protein
MAATQVWAMNSSPATSSAPAIARPTSLPPPRDSSASMEMPSTPRNDNRATAVAARTMDQVKVCGL